MISKCGSLVLPLFLLAGCSRAVSGPAALPIAATPTNPVGATMRATTTVAGAAGVREAPVLGVVVDGALRVVAVEAGGAAAEAGVRPGDRVVALGGTPLNGAGDGKRIIGEVTRMAGTSPVVLAIALTRSGQPLTVTAQLRPPQRWSGMPTPTAVPYDEYYW